MKNDFGYKAGKVKKAFEMDGYYVWDCSVIRAKGKYHMFSSRWKRELGFSSWLFNSEIIHSVSDNPEGPYIFKNVVLKRRGREFFDGMNTHNTCIKEYNGKYYLYYMGTTYGGPIPQCEEEASLDNGYSVETWNRKRIGLAIADDIDGEFRRADTPLLLPRDCSKWDCTCTTNPSVVILPDGKTYMIYKSRSGHKMPLKLGITSAPSPEGPFTRICDTPIFEFEDENKHIEDPFLWYDKKRNKFSMITKDDLKNNSEGITGEWGAGFYAESDDCISFRIGDNPKVYSRSIVWEDGKEETLSNLERPSLLFDENGEPTHIFLAAGHGKSPYEFEGGTFIVSMKLEKEK